MTRTPIVDSIYWVIESDVYANDSRLEEALKELKVPHHVCKFGEDYQKLIDRISKSWHGMIVFHGSYQFTKLLETLQAGWIDFYSRKYLFECNYYYPKFRQFLLNKDYILLPYGDLISRRGWLFDIYASDSLFVKSNRFKGMTGKVLEKGNWEKELSSFKAKLDFDELMVVSPVCHIQKEWRFVVGHKGIVSGSQYKPTTEEEIPEYVYDYVKSVLETVKLGTAVCVLDICELFGGSLKLLEIGPFSCCGLYACDHKKVVSDINQLISDLWVEKGLII